MDLWPTMITVFILAALATIIKYLGGENLIAGYNTSSAAEKEYMKEKGIGAFVGNYIYLLALIDLGGYLLKQAGLVWAQDVAWGLFIAVIIVMLVRVQRFAPPSELAQKKSGKTQTIILILSVIFTLAILGNVAWSSLPPHFNFNKNAMQITGAYGTSIAYSTIEDIRLEPELPPIGYKTNGLNMGSILKGHFKVDKMGSALIFLRSAEGPVIIISCKDRSEPVLINMPDADQTRDLYQKLKDELE